MAIERNQAPTGIALFEPGIDRRVALIVDRGDTDNLVPGTGITMDELHQYPLLGRRLQARAMASALAGLFRAVIRPVKKLVQAHRRVRRQAAAMRQLGALDDHLLRDIGIRRDNIPATVAGSMGYSAGHSAGYSAGTAPAVVVRWPHGQQAACNDDYARAAA